MQIRLTSNGNPNAARTPAPKAPRRNSGHRTTPSSARSASKTGTFVRQALTHGPSPNVYSICSTASDTRSETPTRSTDRPPDISTNPAPDTPSTTNLPDPAHAVPRQPMRTAPTRVSEPSPAPSRSREQPAGCHGLRLPGGESADREHPWGVSSHTTRLPGAMNCRERATVEFRTGERYDPMGRLT